MIGKEDLHMSDERRFNEENWKFEDDTDFLNADSDADSDFVEEDTDFINYDKAKANDSLDEFFESPRNMDLIPEDNSGCDDDFVVYDADPDDYLDIIDKKSSSEETDDDYDSDFEILDQKSDSAESMDDFEFGTQIKDNRYSVSEATLDILSEEESTVFMPHFTIVPKSVSKARVVSLRLNGEIVAYRFKTDKGSYDMYANVAARYGLVAGHKTATYINVEYKHGYLISERELETHQLVPDISNNPEDCKTLINAFINYMTS